MFVLFYLVTMLIGKDYTVGEAFELSYTLLEADGLDGVCAPFLEFLQAATTQPSEDNPRPVTLQDEMGLAHRPIGPVVIRHIREAVVYRLLPGVWPTTMALPDAFAARGQHVQSITTSSTCSGDGIVMP
jgi:hypothetical protein